MTQRNGWFRRWWRRCQVQRRLAGLRREAAAEAEQERRKRAKVAWLVMLHALDAPEERLPQAVRESPALIAAAHEATRDLYRSYRGYGPEPRRAA